MLGEHIFFLSGAVDIYPVLDRIDILITDYSSIYFDWLLLDKPVVFFIPDYDEYTSASRELYDEYEALTAGPKVKSTKELLDRLQAVESVKFKMMREKIRRMIWQTEEGSALIIKKIMELDSEDSAEFAEKPGMRMHKMRLLKSHQRASIK